MPRPCGQTHPKAPSQTADRSRIVGDDEIRRPNDRLDCSNIDRLAGDHGIGNTGQPGDVGWNGNGRLLQTAINSDHIADLTLCVVVNATSPSR